MSTLPCIQGTEMDCAALVFRGSCNISKNNVGSSASGQIHSPVLWSSLQSAGQNNIHCLPSPRHSSVLTSSIRHAISVSESLFCLWFCPYFFFPRSLKDKDASPRLSWLFFSPTQPSSYVSVCYFLNGYGHLGFSGPSAAQDKSRLSHV